MSEEYDDIAEVWWKSKEDFIEAISSPEGQKLRTVFLENGLGRDDLGEVYLLIKVGARRDPDLKCRKSWGSRK